MWRQLLRFLGVVGGGLALVVAFFVFMFRMDTWNEVRWVLQVDVVVGGALALAFVVVRIPTAGEGGSRHHKATIAAAAVLWLVVSGGLMWLHWNQYRIRSGDWQPFIQQ